MVGSLWLAGKSYQPQGINSNSSSSNQVFYEILHIYIHTIAGCNLNHACLSGKFKRFSYNSSLFLAVASNAAVYKNSIP